ncbi:MAG TPA: protein kinase, partial [Thermoanaerobaculia bacterium]|nr:protein kinase [Thermoanaerobaculia bacterium]
MPLTPKQHLGPYAIEELVGAGGMGEVYRARDTRLDRTVAIKVLPAGTGTTASARFEREARAISQLSHPHICRLFDLGNDEGIEFLVMEYLQGATLSERIGRGPLSIREVLRYGSEIADALDHAHRLGITHRDLKPGNIMITAEGAKLLDFGLAKLLEPAPRAHDSTTMAESLTAHGTVVGTTLYMSPEQIEGKPLDHRTDIFSLGIVLYEMLTGARPFEGSSVAAVTASILKSDPRPLPVSLAVPAALQHVIATALEKDPERRWQTAHDLALQLRWINGARSSELAAATATAPRRKRAAWLLLPLILAGGVALGWMAGRLREPAKEAQLPVRLRMSVAPALLRTHVEVVTFALSPEGQRVVFAGSEQGVPALYLRSLDSTQALTIAGTEGGASPFWSPDGRWIGFTARGKLWKVLADRSGTPLAICDVSVTGTVAAWGDGFILFAERPGGRPEIHRVSEDGGTPSAVTKVEPGQYRHSWPQFVPGSNRFVYLSQAHGKMDRSLFVGRLDAIDPKPLLEETSRVRVVGDRVYYVRDGSLVAQRADFAAARLRDEPRRLADQVARFYGTGSADFDVSANGTVIYRTQTSTGRLFITDRAGKEQRTLDDSGVMYGASFSPDGARVAAGLQMPKDALPSIWL